MTMDCKRWAPKSNIYKYIDFIKGMSHALPIPFIKQFLAFMDKYLDKKVITRSDVYRIIEKNNNKK
jgi:hypothetical protein